ncbi:MULTISPECIES: hypothetical protein [Acidobacteriaceae]|uniref:hypothetical protein n=1 Tax=Acidobacteriaceae TaxID=204434 RepID=UPI00131D5517|nr:MULTISPECIES: hypothetical protein [Acidobacteriaceae]MDW5265519.1 hypothetical protein [Edaphobacter sp.]
MKAEEEHQVIELLNLALDANGGLDRWRKVTRLDVRLRLSGSLFELKGYPDGLRDVHVIIDPIAPSVELVPFPRNGTRGLFVPSQVWLQSDDGKRNDELLDPKHAYDGHIRSTPWNDLQFLYFIAYAFWNYFTMPFFLMNSGIVCTEGAEHIESGEIWRSIKAEFPADIDTHSKEQTFYFDNKGFLQRHDYFTDVAKGTVAHYCHDYRCFDGFWFPTRRRVVSRRDDGTTVLSGSSTVLIDIDSVIISSSSDEETLKGK